MTEVETKKTESEMSDEEAIMKIAAAMKDNTSVPDANHSLHTFLNKIVNEKDSKKVGNLRDDKDMNELGLPPHNVRGSFELARISDRIMDNKFFEDYFRDEAENTLATSLSREGFLVRQGNTQTKQVADVTRRKVVNKGWFGKEKVNESGGDTTGAAGN